MSFAKSARSFFELIKFEHTVFALPFAYIGMMMPMKRWPGFWTFLWVTMAMVGARTAAMTLNRLIDLKMDALNPRTKNRPSVTGAVSVKIQWVAVAVSLGLLFVSAYQLNSSCFYLSPVAVVLLTGYHYTKRFTHACHFILGLVLSIAPYGGWIAVTGSHAWQPAILSVSVLFWVAGFDILYSLQDVDFDRVHQLHSIPVKYGVKNSLLFSWVCHVLTVVFLIIFGIAAGLGIIYFVGVAFCGALLKVEHSLIADADLSRINTAFFSINGWIGILLLVFSYMEIFR